jgi:hypothetical protein
VSEQDGVAGSGCGIRSALKCCNTVAVAGACGAGEAHGGASKRLRREREREDRGSGLWLARARIRPDERSRAAWLCGFFL